MDKFLELPLPQKLLALVGVLAVVGGASYYGLIDPVYSDTNNQIVRYRRNMTRYYKLKRFESPAFNQEIERERKELEEKRASYERLLPTRAEVPEFIESLKTDADTSGLEWISFEKQGKNINGPSYIKIPIAIRVRGHYSQLIAFLDAMAAPTKRMVNIESFDIKANMPKLSDVEKSIGDIGLLRVLREREAARQLTPSEQQAKRLILFEEAARRTILDVWIKAYVFRYAGKRSGKRR